jgi:hypothetical protein
MRLFCLLLACCMTAAGCAGSPRVAGDYSAVVGRTTASHLRSALPDILSRHGYRLDRATESASQLTWETGWQPRSVLPSEAAAGVTGAMMQLVLDGRERGGVFTLQLRARSRIRSELQPDWVDAPAPAELAATLSRLRSDLEAEFASGVRRM